MNYELYPWLKDFDKTKIIPFLELKRKELKQNGVATIPNFLTTEALNNARIESVLKGKKAYETNSLHNVYLLDFVL